VKTIARSLVVVLVALIAVPALVVSTALTSAVQLLAATALILGGTQHSLGPNDDPTYIDNYLDWATNDFIVPGYEPQPVGPVNSVAVIYPAEFFPAFGTMTMDDSVAVGRDNVHNCLGASFTSCNYNTGTGADAPKAGDTFSVYGYSQSAIVAALVKNDIIDANDTGLDGTNVFLTSNPLRPNGGILARDFQGFTIPLIGITFYGPTQNSCPATGCVEGDDLVTPTVDVAQEYDFLGGDAPARPLSILAMTNSIMAYALLHGNVQNHALDEPGMIDQGTYGDTHYYMIPSATVPLLLPFVNAGVPAPALAIPNEILKVWINDAYVRDKSPGAHVTFQWSPIGDPISLIGNTLGAIPVGIDDTVEGFTTPGNRPLGTQPSGPFGVGGPDPDQTPALASTTSAPQLKVVEDKQTVTPGDNKPAVVPDADKLGNDTGTTEATTPAATKPDPFAKLRESLTFDPDNRPFGIRPAGDGPLKRIVNALTGQRPKTAAPDNSTDAPKAESESPAA
jgi:hypothetical protein